MSYLCHLVPERREKKYKHWVLLWQDKEQGECVDMITHTSLHSIIHSHTLMHNLTELLAVKTQRHNTKKTQSLKLHPMRMHTLAENYAPNLHIPYIYHPVKSIHYQIRKPVLQIKSEYNNNDNNLGSTDRDLLTNQFTSVYCPYIITLKHTWKINRQCHDITFSQQLWCDLVKVGCQPAL